MQDCFPHLALKGLNLAVAGDVPLAAGLSSSSTLVVAALEAALLLNGLEIPHEKKAVRCGEAEWYVGTRGGAGDHAAMLYAQRQSRSLHPRSSIRGGLEHFVDIKSAI